MNDINRRQDPLEIFLGGKFWFVALINANSASLSNGPGVGGVL
jgi:hypothetical protein